MATTEGCAHSGRCLGQRLRHRHHRPPISPPPRAPSRPRYGGGSYSHAFVSKLNAAGSALVYSTYLGGSGRGRWATGIAVDASGNAYVTGVTGSSDFPTTPGAFQTTLTAGASDAFVTKLNAAGSALLYSTYLGGSSQRLRATGIAVDASGNAYVTGFTDSSDFPTTPGAFQTTYGGGTFCDAFVSKLNAAGSALLYSTYLGGSGDDVGSGIAVDASGNAYVTGVYRLLQFPHHPGRLPDHVRRQVIVRGGIEAMPLWRR